MANTTRLIIDTNWTAATFTAGDLNSLASGGSALSTSVIANGTNLDQYCEVSLTVTVGGTTTATSYLTLYVQKLQQDGTTYGDGLASSATLQPVPSNFANVKGTCGVLAGVASGGTVTADFAFDLPMGDLKLALGNNLGVALSATAALTLKFRTGNFNLNA